jgi:hypothetical protein
LAKRRLTSDLDQIDADSERSAERIELGARGFGSPMRDDMARRHRWNRIDFVPPFNQERIERTHGQIYAKVVSSMDSSIPALIPSLIPVRKILTASGSASASAHRRPRDKTARRRTALSDRQDPQGVVAAIG